LAGTLRNATLELMDSAPGIVTTTDARTIADFIGSVTNKPITICQMKVPSQPRNSVECGAHTVVNLMLSHHHHLWERESNDTLVNRISYTGIEGILKLFADGELRQDFIMERIFQTLGEARCPLITHSRLLAIADAWPSEEMEIKWMGATSVHTWTGKLIKRTATHWRIKYDQDDGVGIVPHKNVCYLAITKPLNWEAALQRSHGDLLGLNLEPPSLMSKVEGDTMTMAQLKRYIEKDPINVKNPHFLKAYAPTTRKHQRQLLTWIRETPTKYDKFTCTEALEKHFTELKKARKWRCSTMLSKLAALQGTLKILPFYYPTAPSVALAGSMHWKTVMKGAQIASNAEEPLQAKPLTTTLLNQILEKVKDSPKIHAALEIAWMTAGRVGDFQEMATRHISEVAADVWMVKFQFGKTARNGAYSIAIPPPSLTTQEYIRNCTTPYLFPALQPAHLKDAMRQIDTLLECRSIRRGRLQELSRGGMTDASLLHISRHASISTLRRYLDYGLASGENIRRAHLAAAATIAAQSSEPIRRLQNFSREAAPPDALLQSTSSEHSLASPTTSEESFPSDLSM
jgi:hypothetical protein